MGNNNNSTMLHCVETTTISPNTATAAPGEQHESYLLRLAFGSKISARDVAAFEEHFSSMAGEFVRRKILNDLLTLNCFLVP